MKVETAGQEDLEQLLELYTQLHDNPMPEMNEDLLSLWQQIQDDKHHFVLVGKEKGKVISSCVVVIIPNLTHQQRPYAVIENVITDEACRGRGCATQVLNKAKEIAEQHHCYKIMLMTGSKKESTLKFYERAGYNCHDKTAFIQWLE